MANEFLPFGTGVGANVLSQSDYAGLTARTNGFVAGVAKSMELNKVWRQSSFMAAMIGDYISAHSFGDALDNGNIGSLRAAFEAAVRRGDMNFAYQSNPGPTNAITISLSPAPSGWDKLLLVPIYFTMNYTNTGDNPTISPNGLTPKIIYRRDSTSVLAKDLTAGVTYLGRWNGFNFVLESVVASEIPRLLFPGQAVYVRVDGNDANDGLADTPSGAFRQISAAIAAVATRYAWSDRVARIKVGDGSYGPVAVERLTNCSVLITGNNTTPTNVLISGGSTHAVSATIGSTVTISGAQLTSLSGCGLLAFDRSAIRPSLVDFGYCQQQHMLASSNSLISMDGNYTISNGASEHMLALAGGVIQVVGRTGNVSGAPVFNTAFAHANNGTLLLNGSSWPGSGTVTGQRYLSEVAGLIYTAGGGANYLPGSIAGTTATSGLYI